MRAPTQAGRWNNSTDSCALVAGLAAFVVDQNLPTGHMPSAAARSSLDKNIEEVTKSKRNTRTPCPCKKLQVDPHRDLARAARDARRHEKYQRRLLTTVTVGSPVVMTAVRNAGHTSQGRSGLAQGAVGFLTGGITGMVAGCAAERHARTMAQTKYFYGSRVHDEDHNSVLMSFLASSLVAVSVATVIYFVQCESPRSFDSTENDELLTDLTQ